MLIKIKHEKFESVELRDGSLVIHSMQGKARVLQENVDEFAVVVQGEMIQIVGFVNKSYAWCFRGSDDFTSERLELDQTYAGGGRLIGDGAGNTHLFYFVKQAIGHGVQLRHHVFKETWSIPQTVSINVFADRSSYTASWHDDGYMHLVYCGHADQRLRYRVFDLKRKLWSGAVEFSDEKASYPQFIPTPERLYLFWQEERNKNILQVRHKEQEWSKVSQVSSGQGHVSSVGYTLDGEEWFVFWGEEGTFYQAPLGSWRERREVEREDYHYAWVIQGYQTLAVYEPRIELPDKAFEPSPSDVQEEIQEQISEQIPEQIQAKEEVPEPEPEPVQASPAKPKDDAAERLQAAFVEQAFRTLQEWEKVREEMASWQRDFRLPDPVDLTPLVTRIERLERRLLSLSQSLEQKGKLWDENISQVEQGLARTRLRLGALEEVEKNKPVPLWVRVLRRG